VTISLLGLPTLKASALSLMGGKRSMSRTRSSRCLMCRHCQETDEQ